MPYSASISPFSGKLRFEMPVRHSKDLAAFKKATRQGKTLKEAKLAAGYSKHVAKMGTYELPKPFKSAWIREKQKYVALARAHSPEDQEDVVRGLLLANMYEGKDRAVQSAKLAGQDKRVNMFTADTQVGLIVIQPPAAMMTELTQRLALPETVTDTTPLVTEDEPT